MAESKYGSNKENAVIDKCQKLGAAVVIFDLLKVKHYNAIDLEKLMKATSPTIKGAAFILYNVARLQTLLATFEQQVAKGFYAPLPAFDQIDFGLLKTEVCLFAYSLSICFSFVNPFKSMLQFNFIFVCFVFFLFYQNRRNGKCFLFMSSVFHQCWNAASMALQMVTFPFIWCAHF